MKARILKACCVTVLPGSVVEVSEGQLKALGAYAEPLEDVKQAQTAAEEKPAAKKPAPKAKKKEA